MKEQSIEKCDQLQQDYQQLQTNIQVLFRQNSEMKQDLERSSPLKIIVNEYLDPFLNQLPDIDTKIIFLRQIQQEFQQSQCDWNPKGLLDRFPAFTSLFQQLQIRYPLYYDLCRSLYEWAANRYNQLQGMNESKMPSPIPTSFFHYQYQVLTSYLHAMLHILKLILIFHEII